ncbi:hypothetical protein AAG747_18630 [Rapidithrix thailandica]|uniref:Thymidylate kinase n=1 Tax=Rapidithrix thailandica TaxID=413964 RepID=A0AAW9SF97_9BACT
MSYNVSSILEKAGHPVTSREKDASCQKIELYYLKNPDGTVRWTWPVHLRKPLFLKFYSVSGLKSRLFVRLIHIVFRWRLQRVVFKKLCYHLDKTHENVSPLFYLDQPWALFTGTPGPNQKAVLVTEVGSKFTFIKLSANGSARKLLQNEANVIEKLNKARLQTFNYPQVLFSNTDLLQLSDVSEKGIRSTRFSNRHLQALAELNKASARVLPLKELTTWHQLKEDLKKITKEKDERIPKGMLRKLTKIVEGMDENIIVETSLSHGDFTPWNMYENQGKLQIYDWELSQENLPIGFDAFHFIIQKGILIDKEPWVEIEKEIKRILSPHNFRKVSSYPVVQRDLNNYLTLYLVYNIVYYLGVYARQEVWHTQVHWLLNTWNEALSSLLVQKVRHRELVLMDLFDFLTNKPYAALKFPEIHPEKVSEYSDVDLCVERKVNKEIREYLASYPLISYLRSEKKSYMATHQLICKDGSLLSLDLIWQFKRKGVVYLDAPELLQNAAANSYGVKKASPRDDFRYLGLFYALNHALIPSKYQSYRNFVKNSHDPIDQQLYTYSLQKKGGTSTLHQLVHTQKHNRGGAYWFNHLNYLGDTVKSIFLHKGMTITFSGVDGAGKSTVIENIRYMVEKQLRKRVVVIRHRPSILPILSAWRLGKIQAEQQAAGTLPRKGTNKNFFSSLLRFGYYYSDYFFGQYIIYLKYIIRGYVVIYDRYYFDFINDSRRSNIQLPSWITRWGYFFLLKPELNFFLYADPEIILHRKQELNAKTIKELTDKYLQLFDRLNPNMKSEQYTPIENVDLNTTLNEIFHKVSTVKSKYEKTH